MNVAVRIRTEQIDHALRDLVQLLVTFVLADFLHNDNILLVDCCDKILRLRAEDSADLLQFIAVLVAVRLHNEYHAAHLGVDVKLLGTVININQQQVVEQQVLDKIILIEPLLICYQKILDLETGNLSHHVYIIAVSACQKNILKLVLIKYLEKLISVHHLTVCR